MIDAAEQILAKNIWELEHRMKEGQGDSRTRLSLVRAYAQQNDLREEGLGVPKPDRSYLRVSDRSREGVLLHQRLTSSTRRFFARPSSVRLSATGAVAP